MNEGRSDPRAATIMAKPEPAEATIRLPKEGTALSAGTVAAQTALDFSSSRIMRRSVSSNRGAFPSRYSRSAPLIKV